MEMKTQQKLQILLPTVSFIILILLVKVMKSNHTHDNRNHNHSLELTDTICVSDSIKLQDTTINAQVKLNKPTKGPSKEEVNKLVRAMIQVESRGDDSAYHAGERAAGCLQIRPIMVAEVNRLLKRRGDSRRFTLADRWSRTKSIEMFKVFNKTRTSLEAMARCWNGGPMGHKKVATLGYWKRVLNNLNNV